MALNSYSCYCITFLILRFVLLLGPELGNFITVSSDSGWAVNPGDTVTASVSVSPDSPEVDKIRLSIHGSATRKLTKRCLNMRSCSLNVTLSNTGEAIITGAVYYGCGRRRRQRVIAAGTLGKVTNPM